MRNVYMQDLDSLCYRVHTHHLDHMCIVYHDVYASRRAYTSRREYHDMMSRSPICRMSRSRSWFSSRYLVYDYIMQSRSMSSVRSRRDL